MPRQLLHMKMPVVMRAPRTLSLANVTALGVSAPSSGEDFVIDSGGVAVRLRHGVGLNMGSSTGEGDTRDDDDRRSSVDQLGQSKDPR